MPMLQCAPCGAAVASVTVCRTCHLYLCAVCSRRGCCGKRPADPEIYVMQGPPLTAEDDDPDDDATDLEFGLQHVEPVADEELQRWATEGGRIVGEDHEIGGEG